VLIHKHGPEPDIEWFQALQQVAEAIGILRARFESYGAGNCLRLGWARRWSMRRIAARVTIASETSGSAS
jgi:hypothetical protein